MLQWFDYEIVIQISINVLINFLFQKKISFLGNLRPANFIYIYTFIHIHILYEYEYELEYEHECKCKYEYEYENEIDVEIDVEIGYREGSILRIQVV